MNLSWFFLNTIKPTININTAHPLQATNWNKVGTLWYKIIVLAKLINWYKGFNLNSFIKENVIMLISYIIGVR